MNPSRRLAAALAVLLLSLPACPALADGLVDGVLGNGVRYLILPRADPRQAVSVRLFVAAGSFDETDGELGYAHFVEHMAFDGTTHYPAGAIGQLFQRLGLSWGPDLNASTHHTHTIYQLELPAGRTSDLSMALGVMRDYADGIQFPSDQVDRESGVVLSEMHQREGEEERATRQIESVLYAATRLPAREVIGTAATVKAATADSLRAFYRRCYTASRMSVVVVGPVDVGVAAGEIQRAFGSLPAATGAAPVRLATLAVPVGLDAAAFADPDLKSAVARYLFSSALPPDTPAGRAELLDERVLVSLFNQRLRARREHSGNRVGLARASLEPEDFGAYQRGQIEIQTLNGAWESGVAVIENELRYARQLGFQSAEIADAVQELRTQVRERVLIEAAAPSKFLAAEITGALAQGRAWRGAQTDAHEAEGTLDALAAPQLAQALRGLFPEGIGHLVIRGGRGLEASPREITAAYAQSVRRGIIALPPRPSSSFAYGDFGPAGLIAASSRDPGLGLDLFRFENGVHLSVRSSRNEPGRFQLRIGLGRGTVDISGRMSGYPALASGLFNACDLGRATNAEVDRLLAVHGVVYQNSLVDGAASIFVSGPAPELPFALRLLTARLSDTRFSRERFGSALSYYAGTREREFNTPLAAATTECLYRFTGNDERVYLPRVETAALYKFSAVYAWLEQNWLNGPIEVGVVGDVTADEVMRAAAVTLGTLPKRKDRAPSGIPKEAAGKPQRSELHGGLEAGSAGACLIWPVEFTGEAKQLAATELAADVLADRLRVALREKLGATYTPEALVRRDRFQRDFGYIQARLTFDADRAGALTGLALGVADRLAHRGVTREEFDRLREPRLTRARDSLASDRWWLDSVVAYAQSEPHGLEEARGFMAAHEEIAMFDVNQAAAALLTANSCAVDVLPAKPADAPPR